MTPQEPAPTDFPRSLEQVACVHGVERSYARRSQRLVRYAVRLPSGVVEPACSAHHVSAIVEGAAGPEGRFTPADVSNLLNGRHSSALLERIPQGVQIFTVRSADPSGTRREFVMPTAKACRRSPERSATPDSAPSGPASMLSEPPSPSSSGPSRAALSSDSAATASPA